MKSLSSAFDLQGGQLKNAVLHNITGSGDWSATTGGIIGWISTASDKRIAFWDDQTASLIKVPRLDRAEVWTAAPAFNAYFTVPGTTKVTNLNADLLDGYNSAATVTADTIALRYTSGRLLVGEPVASGDAATKNYVDTTAQGLNIASLGPVHAATVASVANLSACSVSQDGVTLVEGNYLLVKDTASPDGIIALATKYNGIYTVGVVTTGTAPLTRRTDADTTAELDRCYVFVSDGTVNQGASYVQTTADPVVGTDAIVWTLFYQVVAQNAGNGIDITGNLISVKIEGSTTYVANQILFTGSTSTIDRDANLTWNGTTMTVTGALTVTGASTLATSLTGMLKGASGVVSAVTGATNRVTFWSDANTLSSNAGFTYDATTLTLDADLTFTGAQTIQTSTGNLTLATAAGNGNVVVTPHGTGYLSVTNGIINRGFSTNGSNNNSNYITLTRANNTGEDNVLQWVTASTSQWVLGSGNSYFGGEVFGLRYAPGSTNYLTMSTAGLLTLGGSLTFTGAQTISTSSGILTVTGTGGLTLTSGTSNTLLTQNSVNVFTSEGSGAIVNTLYLKAGNVGIGTTVPGVKFHAVLGGTAPSIVAATQTVAVFQNSAAAGDLARVSITSGNTAAAVLQLGDNDDDDIGGIYYDNATNYLGFRTNNTSDRMMISSAGVVNISQLTASCVVLTDASKNLVSGAAITTGATIARIITVSIGAGTDPLVTHNLGTRQVGVTVKRIGTPYDVILVDCDMYSTTQAQFHFLVDPGAGIYEAIFTA